MQLGRSLKGKSTALNYFPALPINPSWRALSTKLQPALAFVPEAKLLRVQNLREDFQ